MFKFFGHTHKWRTVAIDTRHTWNYVRDPDREFSHILMYQVCDECGARQMDYGDANEDGAEYAKTGNNTVAMSRTRWIEGGIIKPPKHDSEVEWLDNSYAPLRGFENIIKNLKRDPDFKEMLDHQMIDDALGQLEVAVKLYVNNQPRVETD